MTDRITAISVAGFKALPHDNPLVVHLPGNTTSEVQSEAVVDYARRRWSAPI